MLTRKWLVSDRVSILALLKSYFELSLFYIFILPHSPPGRKWPLNLQIRYLYLGIFPSLFYTILYYCRVNSGWPEHSFIFPIRIRSYLVPSYVYYFCQLTICFLLFYYTSARGFLHKKINIIFPRQARMILAEYKIHNAEVLFRHIFLH